MLLELELCNLFKFSTIMLSLTLRRSIWQYVRFLFFFLHILEFTFKGADITTDVQYYYKQVEGMPVIIDLETIIEGKFFYN
jgi:hypothetical protein